MSKWIGILSGLLIGQLVLAVVVQRSGEAYGVFQPRDKLIAFDPKAVDGLRIEDGKTGVTLRRRDGQWRLPETGDFPADQGKLQRLLDQLAGLEKGLAVATSPGAAKRFKVEEGAFERKLSLLANDQPQGVVYLGSSPGFRKVHARPAGEAPVYAVALDTWEASPKADDWIDRAILRLDEAEVIGLELPGLALQRDGDALSLVGLGEGEETNPVEARALLGKVADLRISAVLMGEAAPAGGEELRSWEIKLTRKGGESLTYRFTKPKEGGFYLLKRSDQAPTFKLAEYVVKPIEETTREKLVKAKGAAPGAAGPPAEAPVVRPD